MAYEDDAVSAIENCPDWEETAENPEANDMLSSEEECRKAFESVVKQLAKGD